MTIDQRRHFFPSAPIQTVPGQRAEVEVQLRKGGEAPAAAPCAPTGFEWGMAVGLSRYSYGYSGDSGTVEYVNLTPSFSEFRQSWTAEGFVSEFQPGTGFLVPDDVTWEDFDDGWNKLETVRFGFVTVTPVGPACGLTWEVTWEGGEVPNLRLDYKADAPVLKFRASTIAGEIEVRNLTAIFTAKCAGNKVGEMRLVVLRRQPLS